MFHFASLHHHKKKKKKKKKTEKKKKKKKRYDVQEIVKGQIICQKVNNLSFYKCAISVKRRNRIYVCCFFIKGERNFKAYCSLRLIELLNYFETHYWRFRQTYFFEK